MVRGHRALPGWHAVTGVRARARHTAVGRPSVAAPSPNSCFSGDGVGHVSGGEGGKWGGRLEARGEMCGDRAAGALRRRNLSTSTGGGKEVGAAGDGKRGDVLDQGNDQGGSAHRTRERTEQDREVDLLQEKPLINLMLSVRSPWDVLEMGKHIISSGREQMMPRILRKEISFGPHQTCKFEDGRKTKDSPWGPCPARETNVERKGDGLPPVPCFARAHGLGCFEWQTNGFAAVWMGLWFMGFVAINEGVWFMGERAFDLALLPAQETLVDLYWGSSGEETKLAQKAYMKARNESLATSSTWWYGTRIGSSILAGFINAYFEVYRLISAMYVFRVCGWYISKNARLYYQLRRWL